VLIPSYGMVGMCPDWHTSGMILAAVAVLLGCFLPICGDKVAAPQLACHAVQRELSFWRLPSYLCWRMPDLCSLCSMCVYLGNFHILLLVSVMPMVVYKAADMLVRPHAARLETLGCCTGSHHLRLPAKPPASSRQRLIGTPLC
jgi:hypothetical protein